MKKAYEKPRVYVETFDLLEHIASCNANTSMTDVNYRDSGSCTYKSGAVTLFTQDGGHGCNNEYFAGGDWDDFNQYLDSFKPENGGGCYNAFADGNFFAS